MSDFYQMKLEFDEHTLHDNDHQLTTYTAEDVWKTRNVRTTHCQVSWNHIIFANVATCFLSSSCYNTVCLPNTFTNCHHVHYVNAKWVASLLKISLDIYLLESLSMNCAQNLVALIGSLKAKQLIVPQKPASDIHY